MKVRLELDDALVASARRAAANAGFSLDALVERGLRETLKTRNGVRPFRLKLVTFPGDGLHPEAEATWEHLRAAIYGGRLA